MFQFVYTFVQFVCCLYLSLLCYSMYCCLRLSAISQLRSTQSSSHWRVPQPMPSYSAVMPADTRTVSWKKLCAQDAVSELYMPLRVSLLLYHLFHVLSSRYFCSFLPDKISSIVFNSQYPHLHYFLLYSVFKFLCSVPENRYQ